jgi:hypothetical protein
MRLRLLGSACLLALIATLCSTSLGQPLEVHLSAILDDMSTVPIAVLVAAVGLIGLDVIARRGSAGK